ncbi:MAG: hypothetical protein NC411_04135 [Bacteroides sp.]|nr:hypothetical protein [Bacteroides sp.]
MAKKISYMLTLILSMLAFVMTSCEEDDGLINETYYIYQDEKVPLKIMTDKAAVFFYPENEDALRAELDKNNLTLTWVKKYTLNSLDKHTEAGRELYENLMRGTIIGQYKKVESALKYTVGWSPYYRLEDGCEAIPCMNFLVKLKPDVEYDRLVKLAEDNNVIIASGEEYNLPLTYELACTNDSKGNPVEMAIIFYNSGLFEWSAPNFGGLGHITQL